MISKYPGTCFLCNKPTQAGVDHYDLDSKKSYHAKCEQQNELFSQAEAEQLAERLGYRHIAWDELLSKLGES